MRTKDKHKEVCVKVNAWVDEAIIPLVKALNDFENVETVDSCENHNGSASVYFRCHGNDKETCDFVLGLSRSLGTILNSSSDYVLRLEWMSAEQPMAEIATSQSYVQTLANALVTISKH